MVSLPLQPANAASPIVETFSGMVMLVDNAQPLNASPPIVDTFSGIFTLFRLVQL